MSSSSGGGQGNGDYGGRGVESSSSRWTKGRQAIRRSAAFDDDAEDDDRDPSKYHGHRRRADEALVGYSRSGAETKHKQARERVAPLTIAKQDDSDWMEDRKRRLGLDRHRKELGSLLGGMGAGGMNGSSTADVPTIDRIGHEEQHVGLQVRRANRNETEDVDMATAADTPPASQTAPSPPPAVPLDDDAAARAALLSDGGPRGASAAHDHAVIAPAQPLTEGEALQRDMDARPDEPTLDDYAKMPVEAFGAALLRGMGWREGMGAGKQRQGPTTAPDVKKRAALLGLGAKERQAEEVSDAVTRRKQGRLAHAHRPERRYVPVVRREGERSGQSSPSAASTRNRDRSRSPRPRERGDDSRDRHRDRHGERYRHSDDRREPSRHKGSSDRDRNHRSRDDEEDERRHRRSHDQHYRSEYRDDRRERRTRE